MRGKASLLCLLVLFSFVVGVASAKYFDDSSQINSTDPEISISNDYLIAYVETSESGGGVGTFTLKTKNGYDLLYTSRDHNAWSSYLTIQVDNKNYITGVIAEYGNPISMSQYVEQYPTIIDNSIITKWRLPENIVVIQKLSLVGEACKFNLTIINEGDQERDVKVRYLFDYQVRDQDGAPIVLWRNGEREILKYETKYSGNEINFDYWLTRDYLDSTYTLQGKHIVRGFGATPPDEIIFANWAWAAGYAFSYDAFDPDRNFYTPGEIYSPDSDSCALLYWNLGTISPGEGKEVITYYGVGDPEITIEEFATKMAELADTSVEIMKNDWGKGAAEAMILALEKNKWDTHPIVKTLLYAYEGYSLLFKPVKTIIMKGAEKLTEKFIEIYADRALTEYQIQFFSNKLQLASVWYWTDYEVRKNPDWSFEQKREAAFEYLMGKDCPSDEVRCYPLEKPEISVTPCDCYCLEKCGCFRPECLNVYCYKDENGNVYCGRQGETSSFCGVEPISCDCSICIQTECIQLERFTQVIENAERIVDSYNELANELKNIETLPSDFNPEFYINIINEIEGELKLTRTIDRDNDGHIDPAEDVLIPQIKYTENGIAIKYVPVGHVGPKLNIIKSLYEAGGGVSITYDIAKVGLIIGGVIAKVAAIYYSGGFAIPVVLKAEGILLGVGPAMHILEIEKTFITVPIEDQITVEALKTTQNYAEDSKVLADTLDSFYSTIIRDLTDSKPTPAYKGRGTVRLNVPSIIEVEEGKESAILSGTVEVSNTGSRTLPVTAYITVHPEKSDDVVGFAVLPSDTFNEILNPDGTKIFSFEIPLTKSSNFGCHAYIVKAHVFLGVSEIMTSKKVSIGTTCEVENLYERETTREILAGGIREGESVSTSYTISPESERVFISLSYSGSDLDLHLYDERGRHVGVNYQTGEIENEIPGATYSGPDARNEWIEIINPQGRTYTVRVVGVEVSDIESFVVLSTETPRVNPVMTFIPSTIEIDGYRGDIINTTILLREITGIGSLTNVTVEVTYLTMESNNAQIPSSYVQLEPRILDLGSGDAKQISLCITIPDNALPGKYVGKIIATGETENESIKAEGIISLEVRSLPPTANANGPYTGIEGQPIQFNASLSYDPEGMPLTYYWNFGDGETAVTTQPTISHVYAQQGNYTVKLVVNDSVQNSTPSITYALINDTEPKANFTANQTSGFAPLTVQFNDSSVSYDGIITWEWDFNGDGIIDSNEQNPIYTYDEAGTYTVSLTVHEADGDSNTETKTDYITVTSAVDTEPPTIESVTLDTYINIPNSSFHVTVEATDNVGVTSVTADGVALTKTGSTWEGDIFIPEGTPEGEYTLTITAQDEAGNTAESSVNYSVVFPQGGFAVAIDPMMSSASGGDVKVYQIKIISNENFDDKIHVYMSDEEIPDAYKADFEFNWTDKTIYLRSGETVELSLEVTIPQASGYKMFRVYADSMRFRTSGYCTGIVLIS